ncbi:BTAD domain-containing putative transcriptional regulator [Saccharothrix syringae]|uniref:BTAD domain-containing putative transcriptional regulator n=1 Tax=Saccharothrix syringae TaxID=103733 RepID=UPI001476C116|nr:BTAD domain-containing putative transcriptional regulator [Saccharothrix syringae]
MTSGSSISVQLLGPVRAARGEREIGLGAARQRAVFAVLAVRANQVVSREDLVDGVWGDHPPASVAASVYTYVSGLRRALEPQRTGRAAPSVLVSTDAGYSLRLEPGHSDVEAFERHRQAALHLPPGRALAELDAALALWRGEALAGIPGPFAEAQRARLAELRLATVERRAELALELGRHAEVVAELTGLVARYPLREQARLLLMTALHRGGRTVEALEVYEDARRTVVEELGMDPGPALQELHQRILRGTPQRPAAPARELPPAPRVFGRDAELARLREVVSAVADGRGGCVWLEGEPGVGKSTLLTAVLADAAGRGCEVAWAAGDELGMRFPLRVVFDCLDVGMSSADPRRAALAEALLDPVRTGDPALTAIDGLLELVEQLCAEAPLVVVLDDLQWVDEASLLLWHRLTRLTRQLPLLLVAAARPVPRRGDVTRIRRAVLDAGGALVALEPLPEPVVAEVVAGQLGAAPSPALLRMVAQAGGNPLYTGELVDALVREGAVRVEGGTAELVGGEHEVPRSLGSAVARRLGFLSEPCLEVLRWGALLGTEFAVNDVAVVLGRPASELVAAVEEATAASVLVDAGANLTFRHPLLRHALYQGLPAALRPMLHRQAAEALAAAGAPVEAVAQQVAAGPPEADAWVVDWLAANALEVARRSPDLAIGLLRAPLDHCPEDEERLEPLTVQLVQLMLRTGRRPEAEARRVLARTRNPAYAAHMRYCLGYMYFVDGRVEAAGEVLRAAIDDDATPVVWRARLRPLYARVCREGNGDVVAAEANAREALRLAPDDPFTSALAHQVLWQVETVRRDHAAALEASARALASLDGEWKSILADLHLELLSERAGTLQNLDRHAEADECLRVARDLVGTGMAPGGVHIATALRDYWAGRWDHALAELDAVTQRLSKHGYHGLRERPPALLMHGVAALIEVKRDRVEVALEHLRAAAELPVLNAADREHSGFLLATRAYLVKRAGGGAEEVFMVLAALLDGTDHLDLRYQWVPNATRAAIDTGARELAERAYEVCAREAALERVPGRAAAALARVRGLVEDDPASVREAVAYYRATRRPVELADALEDLSVLLARSGDRAGAETAFREAVALFTDLGAARDVRRAQYRLNRYGLAGPPTAPRPTSGWPALTHWEREVAWLVGAERSNSDIADLLGLPHEVVRAIISRILEKTGHTSRSALGAEAAEHRAG